MSDFPEWHLKSLWMTISTNFSEDEYRIMNLQAITSKLKKFPTAAAALVFSAVFSFLLAPNKLLHTLDFYLVWVLSALFTAHIWYNFKEDRSYRVSGIIPAWLELFAGTILLFFCPVREISLIFIMLAVCSYAAGIIFSLKVTGPLVLFLGIAPNLFTINKTIAQAMGLIYRNLSQFITGRPNEAAEVIAVPSMTLGIPSGSSLLLWAMLLAVFPLAIFFCKSAYERFSMYCVTVFVFFFCDMFRFAILLHIPGPYPSVVAFWLALIIGISAIAGLLYGVNRLAVKGEEK